MEGPDLEYSDLGYQQSAEGRTLSADRYTLSHPQERNRTKEVNFDKRDSGEYNRALSQMWGK